MDITGLSADAIRKRYEYQLDQYDPDGRCAIKAHDHFLVDHPQLRPAPDARQPETPSADDIRQRILEALDQELGRYQPKAPSIAAQAVVSDSLLDQDTERSLIFSDAHFPYVDKRAWDLLVRFAEWFDPTYLVANGDIVDFYTVSKYCKNPERKDRLQEEINAAKSGLREICDAARDADKKFTFGNHENRFKAFLWGKAPELASLDVLNVSDLLDLPSMGFEVFEDHQDLWLPPGDILVTHGNVVRQHSGYTARAEMEKHGCHGVTGHVHRLAEFYKTIHGKPRIWCEGGHLSDASQAEYVINPDWQTGFVVIYHLPDSFIMQTVPILCIGGKQQIFFEGKLWS